MTCGCPVGGQHDPLKTPLLIRSSWAKKKKQNREWNRKSCFWDMMWCRRSFFSVFELELKVISGKDPAQTVPLLTCLLKRQGAVSRVNLKSWGHLTRDGLPTRRFWNKVSDDRGGGVAVCFQHRCPKSRVLHPQKRRVGGGSSVFSPVCLSVPCPHPLTRVSDPFLHGPLAV